MLSVVIARDNNAALFEPNDIRKILDAAIVYLDAVRTALKTAFEASCLPWA